MIYGSFGVPVTILREGHRADVRSLTGRKPDKLDFDAIANCSYVVVRIQASSNLPARDALYHLGHLRADDGFKEIVDAMRAAGIVNRVTEPDC
jgi:hypothetical protein